MRSSNEVGLNAYWICFWEADRIRLAANGAWHLSSCFNEVREPVVDVLRRAVTEGSLKDRHAVAALSLATCEDFCAKEKKNKKK